MCLPQCYSKCGSLAVSGSITLGFVRNALGSRTQESRCFCSRRFWSFTHDSQMLAYSESLGGLVKTDTGFHPQSFWLSRPGVRPRMCILTGVSSSHWEQHWSTLGLETWTISDFVQMQLFLRLYDLSSNRVGLIELIALARTSSSLVPAKLQRLGENFQSQALPILTKTLCQFIEVKWSNWKDFSLSLYWLVV